MKLRNLLMTSVLIVVLILSSVLGTTPALAQPSPPTLISPADGGTAILPTFQWGEVTEAEKYEIQVASDSAFTNELWLQETEDETITPINTLPNGPLYWRVRSLDAGGAGDWSAAWTFTKKIPAPGLSSPVDGGTFTTPTFKWNAANGATYYQIQVATNDTFTPLLWEQTSYDLSLTPISPLPNGLLYWRVRGADADGRKGNFSPKRSVTKYIPAPNLVSPLDGASSVVTPTLKWEKAIDAIYYHIEVADNDTFTPLFWEEDTYNLSLTPISTLPNGLFYWRVTGVDADGNLGDISAVWSFTKHIPKPTLSSPVAGATNVRLPTFKWKAVSGASYYHIQVATDNAFTDIVWEEDTYNLNITPIGLLPTGVLYWRVYGVDTDGNPGTNSATRSFTSAAPPNCTNTSLNLMTPANGSTLTSDPNLKWACRQDATRYRVLIYKSGTLYSSLYTDYTAYTPYNSTSSSTDKPTLPNGSYTWKVEAYQGSTKIDTSSSWSFTKSATFSLLGPANTSTQVNDPLFSWGSLRGASRYKVSIYQDSTLYDYLYIDYPSYTPYNSGASSTDKYTLPNDTYTWKVEAYQGSTLLVTSASWSFTKAASLNLTSPADGTVHTVDPTLTWGAVRGAARYRVLIYKDSSVYASAYTNYASYVLYNDPGSSIDKETLPDNEYTWKIEAYAADNKLITTSATRTFTKAAVLTLLSPADGATLLEDPTLEWAKMTGAHHYKVLIYQDGVLFSYVNTDYTIYTPYNDSASSTDEQSLDNGSYTWKIEVYGTGTTLLTTSPIWSFTVDDSP